MYTQFLKDTFKYDKFREKQLAIIRKVIEDKKDVCGIMFTGIGKSLCFQYVPAYLNKTALVISPLIALMNDQKQKLDKLGIPACCLNSTVTNRLECINKIKNNDYRVIYMTPEYVTKCESFVKDLYELDVLCLIAIDEAHIISNWGTDFRPEYRELHCLKTWVPDIPIIALTATATPQVQKDIVDTLKLVNPYIVKTTFDRPNLYVSILPKTDLICDILTYVDEPTIVYAKTHKDTETIADTLKKFDVHCGAYHAGLTIEERTKVHTDFIEKKITCVIATIAFGMGIDIPIRNVIHYCVSSDIESYYQEIGRAGRDGLPSKCITFFSMSDFRLNNFFIDQISDLEVKQQKALLFKNMRNYIYSTKCRKKFILEYFGESIVKCDNCDICHKKEKCATMNFTTEGKLFLNTILLTGSNYGFGTIYKIISGKAKEDYLKKTLTFGKSNESEIWVKSLCQLLIIHDYIIQKVNTKNPSFGKLLGITDKGIACLADLSEIILEIPSTLAQNFIPKVIKKVKKSNSKKDKEIDIILKEFNNKMEISKIAKKTGLKTMQVENYLVKAYTNKLCKAATFGIKKEHIATIKKLQNKTPNIKLKEIKDNTELTYLQIKIALEYIKKN